MRARFAWTLAIVTAYAIAPGVAKLLFTSLPWVVVPFSALIVIVVFSHELSGPRPGSRPPVRGRSTGGRASPN